MESLRKIGYNIAYMCERGVYMPQTMQSLIEQYVSSIHEIYGSHLRQVILYGSYARGDFKW